MGLTERHWFEDEEPELTDRQLEDAVSIQDRVYRRGYYKGYSDGVNNTTLEFEKEVFGLQTLLKEQETEWEHLWDAPDGTFKGRCKKCGFVHFFIEGHDAQYKFCPECGRSVKRELVR